MVALYPLSMEAQFYSVINRSSWVEVNPVHETVNNGREVLVDNVSSPSLADSTTHEVVKKRVGYPMDVAYPLREMRITSPFGMRTDPFTGKRRMHNGIDLHARKDEVYAMFAGVVKRVGYDRRSGNYVILRHGTLTVSYCHLFKVTVKEEMSVLAGDVVGITGNTGRSTGEHLHITCKFKGDIFDPGVIWGYIESEYKNKR